MEDKETGSDWSHILGKGMAGKLEGTSLKIIPSEMTNWGSWQMRHPETTVTMIKRSHRGFETKMLEYGNRFGLGLAHSGEAKLWKFDDLSFQPVVNDSLEELPVVVYFHASSRTPYAWRRSSVRGEEQPNNPQKARGKLSFRMTAQGVQDKETDSIWDLRRGLSVSGPLEGTRLEAVPAIVTFTSAWQRFHPDSTVWKPNSR